MKTSTNIVFTAREDTTLDRTLSIMVVSDQENESPLDKYNREYWEEHGEYPDMYTAEGKEKYVDLLEESYIAARVQRARVYDSVAGAFDVSIVRAKSAVIEQQVTGEETETDLSLQGNAAVSTKYPVTSISEISYSLITRTGSKYTGTHSVDANGSILFSEEVYGYVTVTYTHTYTLVAVTSTSEEALDKPSSILQVRKGDLVESVEITYPDVQDDETGITPDNGNLWKSRTKEGLKSPFPDRTPWSNHWVEKARTVLPIDIDGVKIDRALSVTLENDTGDELKLMFDLGSSTPTP